MATASSVQREPSMEEILASIRRIIEDSDTGRKQPGEADDLLQDLASVPVPAPAAGTPPEAAGAPPVVDAFRAELRPGLDVRRPRAEIQAADPVIARMGPPVRSDPAPVKAPVTLAQVSARVAAEPTPAAKPDAPATARVAETAVVADWRREIAAVGETVAKPDKAADSAPDKSEMRRPPPAQAKVEVFEDEVTAEPAFEVQPQSVSARPAAVEAPSARPAILSERTGRQVAAAFGELSDAFANRSKKTFDEMAEEMLRPMLQDWLDNNLPTLVERLVREEIERVARGAQ
ncbi:PopZ family protein [Mesorhizobium sp. STM 4661]|uniref:PopZ family protein n=1 Tax=Mesorhizobium sp. STM 4661 TaxID=1297570 RepID=UPI0002BF1DD5|nr:PopZ family protein [Mesorhizobium sp. STM 4661]CCV14351.1 conserved hypothetical protein [Mesorhizobium sp. STM 4661]